MSSTEHKTDVLTFIMFVMEMTLLFTVLILGRERLNNNEGKTGLIPNG